MVENVLLLTIDSLRRDRLSEFGETRDLTPTIDTLASRGTSFSNAFVTGPGTSPSFRSILTGTYPLSYEGLGKLSEERPKVAEILQQQGYDTGGFHSNPFLSKQFRYDQGFNTFKDYQSSIMRLASQVFPNGKIHPRLQILEEWLNITENAKRFYNLFNERGRPYVSAEQITNDTIDWLQHASPPFFCWSHYMDVHHPCFPPKTYRDEYDIPPNVDGPSVSRLYSKMLNNPSDLSEIEVENLINLYDAAIRYTDDQIKKTIDSLKQQELFDDTLIIITSDHGEMFGDHGLFGKPITMYDELIKVPLVIVNGPDYLENISNELFSLIDLPPLIHDALGIEIPNQYEGRLITKEPREFIISEHSRKSDRNRVVIGARSTRRLLEYDSEQDAYTMRDVTQESQDEIAEPPPEMLRRAILTRFEDIELDKIEDLESMELEDGVESRLEELGYL